MKRILLLLSIFPLLFATNIEGQIVSILNKGRKVSKSAKIARTAKTVRKAAKTARVTTKVTASTAAVNKAVVKSRKIAQVKSTPLIKAKKGVTPSAPSGSQVKFNRPPPKPQKTYQTYTKKNSNTAEIYVGRTSGNGTPRKNIAKRDQNHHKNKEAFGKAEIDKTSKNKDAIRGREQQLIEKYRTSGNSANKINGISPKNPKKKQYMDANKKEFGKSNK